MKKARLRWSIDGQAYRQSVRMGPEGIVEVLNDFEIVGEVKPITIEQVREYLAAELSLLAQGPVALDVQELRLAACSGCERRRDAPDDPIGRCSLCGCGNAPRAALSNKAKMPHAECPDERPEWAEAEGQGWPSNNARIAEIAIVIRAARRYIKQRGGPRSLAAELLRS